MKLKTTIATAIAAIALVSLSACTPVASDEPALEKGQAVDTSGQPVVEEAETVPEECLDAFNDGEKIDSLLSEAIMSASRAVGYAIDLDHVGLDEENATLEELVPQVEDARTNYAVAAAVCESAEPPQSCVDALTSSEEVDDLLTEAIESASRTLGYALDLNTSAIEEETAVIEELTPQIEQARTDYKASATSCRTSEGA